jgi:hypothetical protein
MIDSFGREEGFATQSIIRLVLHIQSLSFQVGVVQSKIVAIIIRNK